MKRHIQALLSFFTGIFIVSCSWAQSTVGLKTAEEMINKGDYMQALIKLDSIISKIPDNSEAHALLGKAKASLGDCNGAIESWDTYASLDQNNSWKVNALKADCYVHQGHHEEAIDALSKYLVHDPYHGHSYMIRGQEYYLTSKYALAIQDYSMIINRKLEGHNAFEVYYKRGLAYSEFGMYKDALEDFNKVIELYPQFNYGYFYRGSSYWQLGKYEQAIVDFTKAIELDAKDLHSYYNRGLCYKDEKEFNMAITDFSKVIQLDPNFDEAYNQIAMCLYYKGDWAAAERSFNEYITKFSNYSHAYFNRGMFYAERKNNSKAIADFDYCLQLNPKDADAYFHKSLIFIEQNKIEPACSALQKAEELGNKEAARMSKRYCNTAKKP